MARDQARFLSRYRRRVVPSTYCTRTISKWRRHRDFEQLRREILVQFLAAARQALEHGVVRRDEFDHQHVRGQFRRQVEDVGQRHALRHQHVMDHRQHQHRVELAARAIQEARALLIAPSGPRTRPRHVHRQRQNLQVSLLRALRHTSPSTTGS